MCVLCVIVVYSCIWYRHSITSRWHVCVIPMCRCYTCVYNNVYPPMYNIGVGFERPISLWRTAYSTVTQSRSDLPDAIGAGMCIVVLVYLFGIKYLLFILCHMYKTLYMYIKLVYDLLCLCLLLIYTSYIQWPGSPLMLHTTHPSYRFMLPPKKRLRH